MIRNYQDTDYEQIKELYQHSEWYGGQFDESRDSADKLATKVTAYAEGILVYVDSDQILGTVSIVDDGRMAWLFRFAVKDNNQQVTKELYDQAVKIIKEGGHDQVLVYSPLGDQALGTRYTNLGMQKGGDFTCYWNNI